MKQPEQNLATLVPPADAPVAWPACDRSTAEQCMRMRRLRADDDIEQLAERLVETQDQLLAMYDLARAANRDLGIGETLRHLAGEATRLVQAAGAVLWVGPTLVQHPANLIDECSVLGYLDIARQQESGYLLLNAGYGRLPEGVTNICVLPIAVRGDQPAGLCLINREGGFSAPNLKLARAIADQAGSYIAQAMLYHESLEQARLQAELAVARRVQLQLLPQSRPNIRALDIYAESRPALQVGGDFYDFVAEPDRPLMLLLGDVAGKGVSAAMMMGLIHTATRSAARFMPNPTPASVLSRSNNDLYEDMTLLDAFITAFVVQYLSEQRRIRYANAGHAPVIYRPPGGPARLLEADSVPIGVLPVSLSEDYELDFGPDTLLVVTTDGFSEARDLAGELYGYERLLALVDEFAEQPAQVIAYGLYSAIDLYAAGQPQEDDQTLIVVKGVHL